MMRQPSKIEKAQLNKSAVISKGSKGNIKQSFLTPLGRKTSMLIKSSHQAKIGKLLIDDCQDQFPCLPMKTINGRIDPNPTSTQVSTSASDLFLKAKINFIAQEAKKSQSNYSHKNNLEIQPIEGFNPQSKLITLREIKQKKKMPQQE